MIWILSTPRLLLSLQSRCLRLEKDHCVVHAYIIQLNITVRRASAASACGLSTKQTRKSAAIGMKKWGVQSHDGSSWRNAFQNYNKTLFRYGLKDGRTCIVLKVRIQRVHLGDKCLRDR
jgi:hypothetical protein